MHPLTGISRLMLLIWRRDRIRLPVWILGAGLLVAGLTASYKAVLKSPEDIIAVIQLYITNPSARIFALPSGANLESYAIMRAGLFIAIGIALLNIFLIIRHTRQNEETNREELIRSAKVGRFAGLAAAITAALITNIVITAITAGMFILNDFSVEGSLAAGASWGAVGMAFAGITAVTAQCTKTTRGASGLAAAVLGTNFLLAAMGSILGTVHAAAYSVTPAWPTWLTALGWGQLMRPFSENNWEILAIFVGFTTVCIAVAFALAARRDVGMGILPERRGPAQAARSLLSPLGLVWRLQRGVFFGWLFGVVAIGAIMGSLSESVSSSLSESEDIKNFVVGLGGTDQLVLAFLGVALTILSSVIVAFVIQSMLRARSDEENGTVEQLLAAPVSRLHWLGSYTLYSLLASIVLIMCLGLAEGLTAGLALHDVPHYLAEVVVAVLAHIPALLFFGGLALLGIGLLPRSAAAMAWVTYALAVIAGPILSALVNIPHWAQNLSPFSHIPNTPAEPVTAAPLIILSAIAVALSILGLWCFKRRDIASER